MCCLAEFIVKVVLIVGNVVFSLAGLAVAGLGIAFYIQLQDILDIIPGAVSSLAIGVIVLGCFIFVVSYLACCGAIRESRCMLYMYAIIMAILAAVKIYLAVQVFSFLERAESTVQDWVTIAFNNLDARPAFNVMESIFSCCGTTGPNSYTGSIIPPTCCGNPIDMQCTADESFSGCADTVADWFQAFGVPIGTVMIIIIVVEVVCLVFALHMANTIRNNRKRREVY
ncbi:leukocyte surface antigen CD53-like [Anticarsia gemmatalis]|uniref:leukocyte surface antigen CD53-like n=1 Tax=Anticarsia gemmatalis TaxID=129554 RepID=UPI003F76CD8F